MRNLSSHNGSNASPPAAWQGEWSSDLEGLYETRALVTQTLDGFLPQVAISFQGGEPRLCLNVDLVATLDLAIESAQGLERLWHENSEQLA